MINYGDSATWLPATLLFKSRASGHGRSVSPVEEIGGSGPLSVRRKGLRATRDEGGTAGSSAEEEDGGALHSKGSSARGEGHSVFNVVSVIGRGPCLLS